MKASLSLLLVLFPALWAIPSCSGNSGRDDVPIYTFEIIHAYPHDPEAFTQGLVYENGALYEGTGLYGQSSLRRVDLESGTVLQRHDLPAQYFGEGIAVFEGRIIQLTWKSHTGFVYAKDSFDLIAQFSYPTEGWGLTHDGERLIMSDGSSTLYFLDPESFTETGRLAVGERGVPVSDLNELEYIAGEIYANVWRTDRIARISPRTGEVTGWIDLTGLLDPETAGAEAGVLNGIAFDAENDRLFVTGKRWPSLFEIRLVPRS